MDRADTREPKHSQVETVLQREAKGQSGDKLKSNPEESWGSGGGIPKMAERGSVPGGWQYCVCASIPAARLCTCARRGTAWGEQDRQHSFGPPEG